MTVAASSNGGGDGQKQDGRGKERCNNQIKVRVAAGGNNSHRRSTAEMDNVGDVRWRSTEMTMVWQGGSKKTSRIELLRRMADDRCQN